MLFLLLCVLSFDVCITLSVPVQATDWTLSSPTWRNLCRWARYTVVTHSVIHPMWFIVVIIYRRRHGCEVWGNKLRRETPEIGFQRAPRIGFVSGGAAVRQKNTALLCLIGPQWIFSNIKIRSPQTVSYSPTGSLLGSPTVPQPSKGHSSFRVGGGGGTAPCPLPCLRPSWATSWYSRCFSEYTARNLEQ